MQSDHSGMQSHNSSISENKKILKILSIDGGGIKGLYSLYVLQQIEEKYCKDGTLSDYFDMICGTSTGGLIALGIASGKKISEIIKLYEDNAKAIFPAYSYTNPFAKAFWKPVYFMRQLCGSKYNNQALMDAIDDFFSETTMHQSQNLLCIPSYQLETDRNIVFKYPHHEDLVRDGEIKMRDVALATSAAPTYFPAHYFESDKLSGHFVDGGLWANNPTFVGINEACRYFIGKDREYHDVEILSIGNIQVNSNPIPSYEKSWWQKLLGIDTCWNISRVPKLINILFSSNSKATKEYSDTLNMYLNKNDSRVTRIECRNYSSSSLNNILLDNSSDDFMKSLKTYGQSDGIAHTTSDSELGKESNLPRFFNNKKTFTTTNNLPILCIN
jgi:patatin-like phospholipase/acyl hydrolase